VVQRKWQRKSKRLALKWKLVEPELSIA